MNDMDEIKEVNVVQCEKGHLYPANLHEKCPYCTNFEEKSARFIKERNSLKESYQREFHINTRWENIKIWFDKHFGFLGYLFAVISDRTETYNRKHPRHPLSDPHFFDLYR